MHRAPPELTPWPSRLRRHARAIAGTVAVIVGAGLLGLPAGGSRWWLTAALLPAVAAGIAWCYARFDGPGDLDVHVRAAVHVTSTAVVLHSLGWASLLVPIHLLAVSDLVRATRRPVGRIVLHWVAGVVVAGTLLTAPLGLPTVLDTSTGMLAATTGLVTCALVTRRLDDDERERGRLAMAKERRASRLRAVLAGGWSAVLVVEDGLVVDASPDLAAALGVDDDADVVRALEEHVHPEDQGAVRRALDPSTSAGTERVRLRHADGRWLRLDLQWDRTAAGTVTETVIHVRDVTEQVERQAELERVAMIDPLTGLGNRRLLDRRLPQVCARVERHGDRAAVLFIDLDGFKDVNDRHGHRVGDEVLRLVARDLTGAVRTEDTVVRVGGDEFVALVEQVSEPGDVDRVAARIIATITRPRVVLGREIAVGASIGVRRILAGDQASTVLIHADAAMYRAKRAGRGSIHHHDDTVVPDDEFVAEGWGTG